LRHLKDKIPLKQYGRRVSELAFEKMKMVDKLTAEIKRQLNVASIA